MHVREGGRDLRGYAFATVATLMFAATPAAIIGLGPALPVLDALFYRSLIVAVLLMLWLAHRRALRATPTAAIQAVLVGAVLYAAHACLFYGASPSIGTGTAVALVFTYPVMILIAQAVVRRRWLSLRDTCMSIGLVAAIALVCISPEALGASPIGIAVVLVSAAAYAAFVLFSARLSNGVHPIELTAYVLVGTALSIGIGGSITGSLSVPATASSWWAIALNSAMLGVGMLAYNAGLARIGANRASTIDSTQPAIAAVLGVAILGEGLGLVKAVGIALVVTIAALGSAGLPKFRRQTRCDERETRSILHRHLHLQSRVLRDGLAPKCVCQTVVER